MFLTFLLSLTICYSQTPSAFDKALDEISTDLAAKLKALDKLKIVVLYITDIDKQMTSAGKYLADVISVNIVNNPGSFMVFDRGNLNEIVEAKKLFAEGYIDATKAQELGKILGVNAIIIGNYTQLSNTIKLTLKALDSNTGFVVAASMKDLPLNNDAGVLLGINIVSQEVNNSSTYKPTSGEVTGKVSKNPKCKDSNTGDYCFQNSTNYKIILRFYSPPGKGYVQQDAILDPGQKQTFYDIPVGNYIYSVMRTSNRYPTTSNSGNDGSIKGNVFVEICQEKVFIIR